MLAVFTDLDNCLLDHDTYDFAPALPALGRLRAAGAAVVCTTSKTQAEVEYWLERIGLSHPSIVENGGAVVLEDGRLETLGRPREQITPALREAAAEAGARIRCFADMSVEEIAARCNMEPERARLAAQRRFSEPFVLETPGREDALRTMLERRGLRLVRGGRFCHALAHEGKQTGVAWLCRRWRESGAPLLTIGLGDAPNDEGFLALVDHPVRLRPPDVGPRAWNRRVLELLDRLAAC
jgi:mannosyl-3-phosphoglycerate phosphatase